MAPLKEYNNKFAALSMPIDVYADVVPQMDIGYQILPWIAGFFLLFLTANILSSHRVLRGLFTYPKNIRTLKHGFFGAKPHGEQRLLKVFCPLWENPANIFEKKPFGLLNKVLEGR